jgi:hypothetical protein
VDVLILLELVLDDLGPHPPRPPFEPRVRTAGVGRGIGSWLIARIVVGFGVNRTRRARASVSVFIGHATNPQANRAGAAGAPGDRDVNAAATITTTTKTLAAATARRVIRAALLPVRQ